MPTPEARPLKQSQIDDLEYCLFATPAILKSDEFAPVIKLGICQVTLSTLSEIVEAYNTAFKADYFDGDVVVSKERQMDALMVQTIKFRLLNSLGASEVITLIRDYAKMLGKVGSQVLTDALVLSSSINARTDIGNSKSFLHDMPKPVCTFNNPYEHA